MAFSEYKHKTGSGGSAAQKAGIRYEKKVLDQLSQDFPLGFRPQPSISFVDSSGPRLAIPDGLLRIGHRVAIVEVKITHCEAAWWQLRRLYEPLLNRLTLSPILLIEICKSYDPSVLMPEPIDFIPSLEDAVNGKAPVKVFQWKL